MTIAEGAAKEEIHVFGGQAALSHHHSFQGPTTQEAPPVRYWISGMDTTASHRRGGPVVPVGHKDFRATLTEMIVAARRGKWYRVRQRVPGVVLAVRHAVELT